MPVTTHQKPGYEPISKGPFKVYASPRVMERRKRSLQAMSEGKARRIDSPRSPSKGGR